MRNFIRQIEKNNFSKLLLRLFYALIFLSRWSSSSGHEFITFLGMFSEKNETFFCHKLNVVWFGCFARWTNGKASDKSLMNILDASENLKNFRSAQSEKSFSYFHFHSQTTSRRIYHPHVASPAKLSVQSNLFLSFISHFSGCKDLLRQPESDS